jgi:geranylgeranyl reductase family protein
MESNHFDLAIVGAGPAGCTLAMNLAGSGMRIAVFDKDRFPREKICGDALSGKVVSIMKRLPEGIFERFLAHPSKTHSRGIRFVSPDLSSLFLAFPPPAEPGQHEPGYIFPRKDFDMFMVSETSKMPSVEVFQGEKVLLVAQGNDRVTIQTEHRTLTAAVIAVAEGVNSKIREHIGADPLQKTDFSIGMRTYFANVSGFDSEGSIELFFLGDILPSYIWLFPPVNGISNVGIGMLQKDILKRRISLQSLLEQQIREVPELSARFRNAERVSPYQAHPLPLWGKGNRFSGDRYLLLGDAAGLVDPFTGEGIGNAMASAEVAATILLDCFKKNDYSAKALSGYDRRIKNRLVGELKTGRILLRLARYKWLFNLAVSLGHRNKYLRNLMNAKLAG